MNGPIVWFPGHMAKARRQLQSSLSEVDAVIEILDARLPLSSRNPDFVSLFGAKPCLTLLNKSALADEKREQSFIHKLEREGRRVLAVDCKAYRNIARVTPALRGLVEEKLARDAAKGLTRPLRVMVVGITNVGKSTFINTYTKTKKAKAEDRPGVTREQRWIASPYGVELLDTPGLLWHKFDDPPSASSSPARAPSATRFSTCTRSRMSCSAASRRAIRRCWRRATASKSQRATPSATFSRPSRAAGVSARRRRIDEERTAAVLLDEFRGGRIGRITLD
ncbi:MAG: ribosome biogenesis GTPase YlqF [Acutalibacteraceae bacterium]